MRKILIIAVIATTLASSAQAGSLIRNACLKAGRSAATSQLCGCIQSVADSALKKKADQKLAASFFADPHKAQEIRQSDRSSHESFWQRYKFWGNKASEVCAPEKG